MDFDINFWAVVVAAVSNMVVGFLWYGPLFSKPWAKEMGFNLEDKERMAAMQKEAQTAYPQMLIGAVLMAYVFAHVLQAFDSNSVGMAIEGAIYTWLGFIVPVKYGDKLWGGKSLKLFFIDAGYYLVALAIMAIILQVWK
jgi:hypothetical protein